ncbi:MAG: TIM barrel protein [bacterium]|nr:TIM barrel protein [bacterium]
MLAFSTSWNADGRFTPRGLLTTVRGFGFGAIELSYFHREDEVRALLSGARETGLRIASVHNFCPLPPGPEARRARSEVLLLSSLDDRERREAVERTRRSIDTAAAAGAAVLVMHLGRVEVAPGTRTLIGLYRAGRKGSREYGAVRGRLERRRAGRARRHLDQVFRSLDALCPAAAGAGVTLAVENRFHYREIPSYDECREILDRFSGAAVGYWHDVGHAQVMENLGFPAHEEWLGAAGGRLRGFHIHDALLCEDHMPPGDGMVDFARLGPYARPDVEWVLELSPAHPPQAVARGLDGLRSATGRGTGIGGNRRPER